MKCEWENEECEIRKGRKANNVYDKQNNVMNSYNLIALITV